MNYSNFDVRLHFKPLKKVSVREENVVPRSRRKSAANLETPVKRPIGKRLAKTACLLAMGIFLASRSEAASVDISQPSMDRWMYPFASNPGNEAAAPVFGSVNDTSGAFDQRDGQMLLGFNTAGSIAKGLGAANYLISSVTIALTISNSLYVYDPTYDAYTTYLDPSSVNYTADNDAGHPIELYGIGFRNGFNAQTFTETSAFGTMTTGGRNAYAMDYVNDVATDVSNNVSGGFNPSPWAIGTTTTVNPGDIAPEGTTFTFTLNLSNPLVLAYLQQALNTGTLDFAVTSLAAASQPGTGGAAAYPAFYTKETLIGTPADLSIEYTLVPEPGSAALLAIGASAVLMRRRKVGGK